MTLVLSDSPLDYLASAAGQGREAAPPPMRDLGQERRQLGPAPPEPEPQLERRLRHRV